MERDFLEKLDVGNGVKMGKEAIDAIMAEYGRGIENAKKPFADYDTVKTQLSEAQTALETIKKDGQTIEDAQKAAADWEKKFKDAEEAHKAELADRDFNDTLSAAITAAKGKNAKAISALLDKDTLKASKNQAADIEAAVKALAESDAYLFDSGETPPPYAGGTGKGDTSGKAPETLAGALHELYKN